MLPDSFRCCLVKKTGKDRIEVAVERRPMHELPPGDVLIEAAYSSVNYKDAMAAQGHPGVVRKFPHVPGIDAAGRIVASSVPQFQVGEAVLATSYEFGAERWGGWSEYVRAPAKWVVPLPPGLSLEESMTLGTAGLTAGLCVRALQDHGIDPDGGPVLVTGATGGVGVLAVMLLARLGYRVTAASGKADRREWLKARGASEVIRREEILKDGGRPLLKSRWAGAIDTVGGPMLASLLRSIQREGCAAICGVVGGADVNASVYPFILRGVTLRGVDSAWCSMSRRKEVWERLAGPWRLESLDAVRETIGLSDLPEKIDSWFAGSHVGRTVVDLRR